MSKNFQQIDKPNNWLGATLVSVITIILVFFGSLRIKTLEAVESTSNMAVFWFTFRAFMLTAGLPLWIIRFKMKEDFANFGLRLPENLPYALKTTFLLLFINIPIIYVLSAQKELQEFYSLRGLPFAYFFLQAIMFSGLYYFAEEFIFRGFLFFGLLRRVGLHSFWITSLIFAAFHFSKPLVEIFYALLLSFALCYTSYKTKSFLPAAAIHYVLALTLNVLVSYWWLGPIGSSIRF